MIEKISLKIFWSAMLLCATTVLLTVWLTDEPNPVQAKLILTFFVIGLASFLVWLPRMIIRFYNTIEKDNQIQ